MNAHRRAIEGVVNEAEGEFIHYQYELRGVSYSASQDVSALTRMLPENRGLLLGPASVRFDPRNPANSIVICEQWSGMRGGARIGEAANGDEDV